MKKVRFAYLPKSKVYDMYNMDGPSELDLKTGNYGEKVIQIDEYGKGDIMGVDSLINDEAFAFTGVTSLPTELVIINFEDVMKMMTPDLKSQMQGLLKVYPDEKTMRKMFLEKVRWKTFKKKFLNGQIYDMKTKKKNATLKQVMSPRSKRKTLIPKDLIGYVKGSKKQNYLQILERINTNTKRLSKVPFNYPRTEKYKYQVPDILKRKKRHKRSKSYQLTKMRGFKSQSGSVKPILKYPSHYKNTKTIHSAVLGSSQKIIGRKGSKRSSLHLNHLRSLSSNVNVTSKSV